MKLGLVYELKVFSGGQIGGLDFPEGGFGDISGNGGGESLIVNIGIRLR